MVVGRSAVEYVRARSGERATRSREVDLSHLKGFHLRFTPKMWSGVTCNWCLRLHLKVLELSGGKNPGERIGSTPIDQITENNRTCLLFSCVSIERANLFTLYLSEYEERF